MYRIFKALRGLKDREQFGLHPDATSLSVALYEFERLNRGHSHQLDEIATLCSKSWGVATEQMRARAHTFVLTLDCVLDAAFKTPDWQIPCRVEFVEFWTMEDETGAMQFRALEKLRRFLRREVRVPPAFRLEDPDVVPGGRSLKFTGWLLHVKSGKRARLELVVPDAKLTSLGGCWLGMRAFRRQVAEMLARPETLPEFSFLGEDAVKAKAFRAHLQDFLEHCPPEERKWFAQNWSSLNADSKLPPRDAARL